MHDRAARLKRSPIESSPRNDDCSDNLEIAALRDRQRARLVRAIVKATGGRPFTAAQLWRYAIEVCPDLRQAFERAGVPSPRCLGKRLERLQDRSWDGFRVQRSKDEHGRALWFGWSA